MFSAANRTLERELETRHHEQVQDEQQTQTLIAELQRLKSECDALHKKLQTADARANISNKLIADFVIIFSTYEKIKQKLPASMREDAIQTEHLVFAAAETSKKQLDTLIFYPDYQAKHLAYAKDYSAHLQEEEETIVAGQQSIYVQRAQSQARFNNFFKITGLLSLVGVGLPFLITGLILNLGNLISASLKMKQLKSELAEVENKKESNFHPQLHLLHMQIENQALTRLKQGFFNTAKALAPLNVQLKDHLPDENLRR